MNSVSSLSSPNIASYSGVGSTSKTPTAFDINAGEFGPAVASASDGTSTSYSFSDESLKKLSDLANSAVDGIENAASDVGTAISNVGHAIGDDVKKAYGAVKNSVASIASKAENAASSLEDDASSVASAVGDAALYVKDEFVSAADSASHYLAAGVSALV
jgi:phage-related protein